MPDKYTCCHAVGKCRGMLQTTVRLFSAVALLASVATVVLFVQLYGGGSEVVPVSMGQQVDWLHLSGRMDHLQLLQRERHSERLNRSWAVSVSGKHTLSEPVLVVSRLTVSEPPTSTPAAEHHAASVSASQVCATSEVDTNASLSEASQSDTDTAFSDIDSSSYAAHTISPPATARVQAIPKTKTTPQHLLEQDRDESAVPTVLLRGDTNSRKAPLRSPQLLVLEKPKTNTHHIPVPQSLPGDHPASAPQSLPGGDLPASAPQSLPGGDLPASAPQFLPGGDLPASAPQSLPGGDLPASAPTPAKPLSTQRLSSPRYSAPSSMFSRAAAPASPPGGQGYVLAVNYYEQQTMGLRNMFQLQCWAQYLNLLVVKPVMHDSFLRTPLDSQQQSKFLRLEDSFNLTQWRQLSERQHFAQLVEWSQFLSRAPRDVIMVQFEHPSVALLKSRQRAGQGLLHRPDPQQFGSGCSGKWPTASEVHFLQSKGFRVVHTTCFNFYYGDQLSLETFNEHILNGRPPSSVTIVMEMWRGISSAQRVLLQDVCRSFPLIQEHVGLSPRLGQQAEQYIHKYLRGQPYLAVMGRLEITQLTVHKKVPVVPFCLQETLASWREYKRETQLQNTFLSIDIGRYGSKRYRSSLEPGLEMVFQKFFQGLFGETMTVRKWEETFELVAGCRDAGYIGLLQKALVTRAKCILFVGGGAFQRHALHLYKQLHPSPQAQCYHVVKTCTRSSKLE